MVFLGLLILGGGAALVWGAVRGKSLIALLQGVLAPKAATPAAAAPAAAQ